MQTEELVDVDPTFRLLPSELYPTHAKSVLLIQTLSYIARSVSIPDKYL